MLARVELSLTQTNDSGTTVRLMFYTLRVFINAYGYCRLSQCTLTSCTGVCVCVGEYMSLLLCGCAYGCVYVCVRVGLCIVWIDVEHLICLPFAHCKAKGCSSRRNEVAPRLTDNADQLDKLPSCSRNLQRWQRQRRRRRWRQMRFASTSRTRFN